ncbi:MAG: FAD-binding oxidoreductase [Gemmatimonadales bacterium]
MQPSAELVRALRQVVGERWVRLDPHVREIYAADALPTLHSTPSLIISPGTRAEVQQTVQILSYHDVPFVARGAGTGLSGGALAGPESVLLVLTRLNRIIEVDPVDRVARIEPGVVNIRLSDRAAGHGLYYAPDPSSQTACTIGGNIAENAGGPHCLKYGVTTNHVLQLDVVLPDGEIARLGSRSGLSPGLDLVSAFVGSEGMFGIVVEATVRLMPIPATVRTLLADFDTIAQAGESVSAIIAAGIVPAALELIDQNCIRAVESSVFAAGLSTDVAAVLIVELDGHSTRSVETDVRAVEGILQHRTQSIQIASDPEHRARLWHARKKAYGALGRISPDLAVQDAVVPRTRLPEILNVIADIADHYHISVSNVFHAGDGNLHPNIAYDSNDPDETRRVEAAAAEIMQACIEAGGTITGEHGVGMDKLKYMIELFDADTLAAMSAVRDAFDPDGRANPGKVIPIHSCSEWKR